MDSGAEVSLIAEEALLKLGVGSMVRESSKPWCAITGFAGRKFN